MKTALLATLLVVGLVSPAWADPSPLDANHDGKVSREEFRTQRVNLVMSADQNGDGQVSPQELAATHPDRARSERAFRMLDRNQDGLLSRVEVEAAMDMRFRTLDADGDGFLSAAERQNWKTAAPL